MIVPGKTFGRHGANAATLPLVLGICRQGHAPFVNSSQSSLCKFKSYHWTEKEKRAAVSLMPSLEFRLRPASYDFACSVSETFMHFYKLTQLPVIVCQEAYSGTRGTTGAGGSDPELS
jgi:hypothetical protein